MPGMYYHKGKDRWRVRWYPEGKKERSQRSFKTEAEALAFIESGAFSERSRRGRTRRTASEVAEFIIANSLASEDGCRVWTRPLSRDGYPQLAWTCDEGYVLRGAHRIAHHLFVAPVPDNHLLSVDHLCRNRACVEPTHLELVTQRENILRSPIAPGARNAGKTHCPSGHPYSKENTYVYTFKTKRTTTRICKTCAAEHQRRYRLQRMGVSA